MPAPKMIDGKSDECEPTASSGRNRRMQPELLLAMCALVLGVYMYTAHSGYSVASRFDPAYDYYNLLVRGFRAGQLNLKIDVPPGFAQSANPYDPAASFKYPLLDMSYYSGKLYLYFGVTPTLLVFWPYVTLTGCSLAEKYATIAFCFVGFLISVGLLHALWRRYFAEVSVAVVAAGVLALGLVNGVPPLLARCDVHEVPISCGYALTMLSLAAIWNALHQPKHRCWWSGAASLAYGLAIGARPSLLFGVAILLVPVVYAWRQRSPLGPMLAAALGPVTLIGLGLMLYNYFRYDNPLEFGWHYQLTAKSQVARQFFSPRFLWFNFCVYFLEPARWGIRFPYVHEGATPPMPADYGQPMSCLGVLINIPAVWFALAVPLACRYRSGQANTVPLRWFIATALLLFGVCALTVGLFCDSNPRYEEDFLPALVLLAVIGILSLERALASPPESGLACRPLRRRAMRWVWSLLLGFSVAFNLLVSVNRSAEAYNNFGRALLNAGDIPDAIPQFEQAVRLQPGFAAAHNNLGALLWRTGDLRGAAAQFEQALSVQPDDVAAHYNLGGLLWSTGNLRDATAQFEQAVRLRPDHALAHYNLGVALEHTDRLQEAIGHFEQVVRLQPDLPAAHSHLGAALLKEDKLPEAIDQLGQALRLNPDDADAHYNLANALLQTGKTQEAIGHYQQALRIRSDFIEAQFGLARALAAH
jgi:tetratricopeptide (TPR) repeat protein